VGADDFAQARVGVQRTRGCQSCCGAPVVLKCCTCPRETKFWPGWKVCWQASVTTTRLL
jgi:hypothetical protein